MLAPALLVLLTSAASAQEVASGLVLGERLYVRLSESAPDLLARSVGLLGRRLAAATEGAVTAEVGEGRPQIEVAVRDPRLPGSPLWDADQSYELSVAATGVAIRAANPVGAAYGLAALADALHRDADEGWLLRAGRWEAAPDLPLRAVHLPRLPRDPSERKGWCERLASLRMNAVVIQDGIWWQLDQERELAAARAALADFRAYGIEPIPELQSLGWAHSLLTLDPMCAEGAWVEREQMQLTGQEPIALARPNVLRTEATDIAAEDAEGRPYVAGRDYEVLDGETRYPYRPEATPYRLRRLETGRIPDGATVFVSYDYVSRVNAGSCPYCPSEPRVAARMTAAVRSTVCLLRPAAIHLGYDEPALLNVDRRCRSRSLSNAELLTEDIGRLYTAAREGDAAVRVMLWADCLNPHQGGGSLATVDALPRLPRDLVLGLRFLGPDQPDREGVASLRYFGALGFATTGSLWDDPACAAGWARQCRAARLRGEECLGVIYTGWGERWQGLAGFAQTAWSAPGVAGP